MAASRLTEGGGGVGVFSRWPGHSMFIDLGGGVFGAKGGARRKVARRDQESAEDECLDGPSG